MIEFYEGGYDATANNRTLVIDYLITGDEQRVCPFQLEIFEGEQDRYKDFTAIYPYKELSHYDFEIW